MRYHPVFLLVCVVTVLLAGCADFRTVSRQTWPTEQVEMSEELLDLYREVAARPDVIRALDGYADIWIKTPSREERVYSTIQLVKEQDMRIIVSSGILGWPVADMLFRPDSLFIHDMHNNSLFVGSNYPDNLEKVFGLRADYRLFSDVLTGLIPVSSSPDAIEAVFRSEGKVSYRIADRAGGKELLVDLLSRNVEGVLVRDAFGRKLLEMHFRRFIPQSSGDRTVNLPQEIDVLMFNRHLAGEAQHELVIRYDERTINPEKLDIRYRLPENARVIELDRMGMLPWM